MSSGNESDAQIMHARLQILHAPHIGTAQLVSRTANQNVVNL